MVMHVRTVFKPISCSAQGERVRETHTAREREREIHVFIPHSSVHGGAFGRESEETDDHPADALAFDEPVGASSCSWTKLGVMPRCLDPAAAVTGQSAILSVPASTPARQPHHTGHLSVATHPSSSALTHASHAATLQLRRLGRRRHGHSLAQARDDLVVDVVAFGMHLVIGGVLDRVSHWTATPDEVSRSGGTTQRVRRALLCGRTLDPLDGRQPQAVSLQRCGLIEALRDDGD